ncbi:G-type lectin S-receptor-like serine/threonine-protein kinase SD1-1 [Cornus florida]|uniref:G-type lectin S-receptor-like serine/threonine-protein kinase SD1-1 n=1 Tax=Cornus florida TaxID=4283 RepID=UPI002898A399|nr:G-type lectin S-receptor-like serine/threonine-protein kinase SD1-1 [Cornus florida]
MQAENRNYLGAVVKSFNSQETESTRLEIHTNYEESLELPKFNMVTIAEATNNFSHSNKIGEGGFGPVYKGKLSDGLEIAVKRLSESSRQGLNEFKNEVMLIAKLQHRNLVRLLGCCIQGEERLLIYEYMPNGSLDSLIFGNSRINFFVWRRRFDIIVGIARGILYLHRDSRLRIIHRDLKASNVLLDSEMNPKISDFGMARAFGADQQLAKTKMVVGTYGYMSPEYTIDGIFSIKSDVFSFGVLVLEIVSGKRNRQFNHPNHGLNLLGHAWKLWSEGKAFGVIDPVMEDSFPMSEVLRCIQVGLLCVQRCPEDRPTMSSVLLMLDNESAMLPQPKQPGFYTERSPDDTEFSLPGTQSTTNKMTVTVLDGR